jgi:hypothetical protein
VEVVPAVLGQVADWADKSRSSGVRTPALLQPATNLPNYIKISTTLSSRLLAGSTQIEEEPVSSSVTTAARERGDFDIAAVIVGEACALIDDIPTAGEIVERIVIQAERLLPPSRGSTS